MSSVTVCPHGAMQLKLSAQGPHKRQEINEKCMLEVLRSKSYA